MTARRNSARLAMAVSSILAAPALVTGLGLVAGLAVAPEARAQETSSQMAGYVFDAAGNPVAGAQVTVLHASSGTSSTASTTAAGQFIVTGLRVGGPYTVSVSASLFILKMEPTKGSDSANALHVGPGSGNVNLAGLMNARATAPHNVE